MAARNPSRSAVPKRVLAGHSRIWGGRMPAGAREQLEKEYARAAFKKRARAKNPSWRRTMKRSKKVDRASIGTPYGGPWAQQDSKQARRRYRAAKKTSRSKRSHQVKRRYARDTYGMLENPRNPAESAAAVYEGFHGRPSAEWLNIDTPIQEHKFLAALGTLKSLIIKGPLGKVTLKNFGQNQQGIPAILETNEKRNQLFIDGGDQSCDLSAFGISEPVHELEVLGLCTQVIYHTVKDHLGKDGGDANYKHGFGPEKKKTFNFGRLLGRFGSKRKRPAYPTVIYDTRNRLLSFAGGIYTIPDEGITN